MTRRFRGDIWRRHASFRIFAVALALLLLSALTHAEDVVHERHNVQISSTDKHEPAIVITINPEARISALPAGPLPTGPCGAPVELPVRIVNQGFVTVQLEAELVDDVPAGVTLDFYPAPLKGLPEEVRALRITMTEPGPADITMAFGAHNAAMRDLGGRERVHFLLRCVPKSAGTRYFPSNKRQAGRLECARSIDAASVCSDNGSRRSGFVGEGADLLAEFKMHPAVAMSCHMANGNHPGG